jgi:hypothetical protein
MSSLKPLGEIAGAFLFLLESIFRGAHLPCKDLLGITLGFRVCFRSLTRVGMMRDEVNIYHNTHKGAASWCMDPMGLTASQTNRLRCG